MNKTLTIKNLPAKVILALAGIFLLGLVLNACQMGNAINADSVQWTTWMNSAGDSVYFYVDLGRVFDEGESHSFVFEEKDGYIQCTFDDGYTPFLEMNRLKGDRLFCLTTNEMYYFIDETE